MKSLKIYIKPLSSFKTKFHSDTLFGQFCWIYGYIYGFDKLKKIIKNINENDFIAFSDGFINDLLPRPLIEPYSFEDSELKNAKEYKKTEFVSAEFLIENRKNLNDKSIFKFCLEKEEPSNAVNTVVVDTLKNSINRITGTSSEGQLYNSEETYFNDDVKIAIYTKYNESVISKDELLYILNKMGELGFGKDASTGKGRFKIDHGNAAITDDPDELKSFDGVNAFMSLSHGIPGTYNGEPDCKLNYGKIITKFPKHGSFLSNDDYFKNPFIVYKPGSTFLINDSNRIKEIYGKVLNNLSKHGENHVQGTFLLPFFIKI